MNTLPSSIESVVTALEARARAAQSLQALAFSIVNDSYSLISFRQTLFFNGNEGETLLAVSGLAKPTEDSPYLVWLKRVWPWLRTHVSMQQMPWLALDALQDAPADITDGWQEWWPQGAYVLPLKSFGQDPIAWVVFLLETPPQPAVVAGLQRLSESWAYCTAALQQRDKPGIAIRLWRVLRQRKLWLLIAVLCLLMIPVRESALAPAEVISLDAVAISAPLDGVITEIMVRPNQSVHRGDLLFRLDDRTLKNRLAVMQHAVAVADAELIAATQKAFDHAKSKSELALLSGRAHQKRAELAEIQSLLSRVDVRAPHDGIAVFGDSNDWQGRPVKTGEKIMLLANPEERGVLIYLPVADAIALNEGQAVKLFLTTRPLSPLSAEIVETSYQAHLSPDNIASYRLRARLMDTNAPARIGLRGTAKIQGERVALGYYFFRRPLATLREWSGW